jgi:hypothetical protein
MLTGVGLPRALGGASGLYADLRQYGPDGVGSVSASLFFWSPPQSVTAPSSLLKYPAELKYLAERKHKIGLKKECSFSLSLLSLLSLSLTLCLSTFSLPVSRISLSRISLSLSLSLSLLSLFSRSFLALLSLARSFLALSRSLSKTVGVLCAATVAGGG